MSKKLRRKKVNKDTFSQKRRKKRTQHLAGKVPVDVGKFWDRAKTLEQNYLAIGLATDPNRSVAGMDIDAKDKPLSVGSMTSELERIQATVVPVYEVKSMNLKEQRLLMQLESKHKNNVAAMARDIKINIHQWTEGQLNNRLQLLHKLQNM